MFDILDTEGKACTGDDATRATQSDPPSPMCQALASEEVQQESKTTTTTNVTLIGEELHLDELEEDAGIGYKMFPRNYRMLKKPVSAKLLYEELNMSVH